MGSTFPNEFGRLTASQFKELIDNLPELRRQGAQLQTAFARLPSSRVDELLQSGYSWADVYELTFHEHLALVIYGLNLSSYVKEVAALDDPNGRLAGDFWTMELPDNHPINVEKQQLIGLVFSLQRTILSVMLYQRSMSSLIHEVREEGSTTALFKAVRVDRSAVATPSIADRIARAELRKDEVFFQHLRSALKGPLRKHWEAYNDLRYALFALREMGLESLSDAQLEHLMVDVLRVYPRHPSARKNLRAQYYQSKKIKTI